MFLFIAPTGKVLYITHKDPGQPYRKGLVAAETRELADQALEWFITHGAGQLAVIQQTPEQFVDEIGRAEGYGCNCVLCYAGKDEDGLPRNEVLPFEKARQRAFQVPLVAEAPVRIVQVGPMDGNSLSGPC